MCQQILLYNPGKFLNIAIGETSDLKISTSYLHLCGITDDGLLWHTSRPSRRDSHGLWVKFVDVAAEAGDYGPFVRVACTCKGSPSSNELYLCAISDDGKLWLTTRREDGSWAPFIDVGKRAKGKSFFFTDVDCAVTYSVKDSTNKELHICAVTNDGHIYHAIRVNDSYWIPFDDVKAKARWTCGCCWSY
ncbi:MAG: hypothetical protein FD167_3290 [bacterium]|nr:MAG: hypothetical protein FD167_3290 [bacterium]